MGNARFYYGNNSRDVYVTKFSYGWSLATRGNSQARQAQTVYAWRAVQSDLTVELQFPSLEKYRDFAEFARRYHLAVTSVAGQVGDTVPAMYFVSDSIPHQTLDEDGMAYRGGIKYAVALPSIPVVYTNDSVAPTMRLTLNILMDETGDLALSGISSSRVSGSMRTMIGDSVKPSDVKSNGDRAYSKTKSSAAGVW